MGPRGSTKVNISRPSMPPTGGLMNATFMIGKTLARSALRFEHGVQQSGKGLVQFFAAERIDPFHALAVRGDDAGVAQHLEMVRDRRLRHADPERAARRLPLVRQRAHDAQAERVAEGIEDVSL